MPRSICGTRSRLLGETHPQRTAWVRAYLERAAGQIEADITALEAEGKDLTCTVTQRQAVRRTVGYYDGTAYMCYDEYLARAGRLGRAWWKVRVGTW